MRRDCTSRVLTVLGPCKDHEEHLEKQQWWCCPRALQDVTSAQNIVPFPRSHWSPAPRLLRVRQHQQPREGSQHKSFLVPIAAPFSRHPSQGNLGGRGSLGLLRASLEAGCSLRDPSEGSRRPSGAPWAAPGRAIASTILVLSDARAWSVFQRWGCWRVKQSGHFIHLVL